MRDMCVTCGNLYRLDAPLHDLIAPLQVIDPDLGWVLLRLFDEKHSLMTDLAAVVDGSFVFLKRVPVDEIAPGLAGLDVQGRGWSQPLLRSLEEWGTAIDGPFDRDRIDRLRTALVQSDIGNVLDELKSAADRIRQILASNFTLDEILRNTKTVERRSWAT
jgi:hypothetical protein